MEESTKYFIAIDGTLHKTTKEINIEYSSIISLKWIMPCSFPPTHVKQRSGRAGAVGNLLV
jgi:hypothetical protein